MEPLRRATPEPSSEATGNYAVTDRDSVVRLLDLLHQRHSLLSAHWPGEPEAYGTTVLGVYPEQGFFVLDELNPRHGHDKLVARRELATMGRIDGISIRFTASVQELGSKEGVAFYKCAFPRQVQYLQRRNRHRVSLIGAVPKFTATLGRAPATTPVTGTLHDISAEGLGLVVEGSTTFYRGQTLGACTFRLPNEGEFRVDVEVRHVEKLADRRLLRVGVRMLDVDRPTRRRLEAAIARLERELARRVRPD